MVQASSESAVDEFELETDEDDSETLDADDDRPVESGHAILITNRKLPHAGEMHINRQTQQIVDASDPDAIALIVCEDGGDGLGCPACGATPARTGHLFRKARIGAPFLLGGLLPTLLEYAPDGARPADQPYRCLLYTSRCV